MFRKILFWVFPLALFAGGTDSGTILLYNDAPYILTAVIQASDGSFLGQYTIQPNQQKNFTQNLSPTNYNHPSMPQVSLTPYLVIWQCPSEGIYSMCTKVSPGAMVRANDCPGYRICSARKKEAANAPASTLKKKKR